MIPAIFEEANILVCPPEGEEGPKIPMWKGNLDSGIPVVISSWELNEDELKEILRTRRIWVIEQGESHHPMAIVVIKPIEQRPLEGLNVGASHWQPPTQPIVIKPPAGDLTIDFGK